MLYGQTMWQGFDRFSLKHDASSQQETTLGDAEHISTIAGSLASIGTTETPVRMKSLANCLMCATSFTTFLFSVHRRARVRH